MIIPTIALRGITVFPEMLLHFDIGREKSVKALEEALHNRQDVFLVAQKDIRVGEPGAQDLCAMGTISQIRQLIRLPGDAVRVLVEGAERARLVQVTRETPFMLAEVETVPDEGRGRVSAKRVEALIRSVRGVFEVYITMAPRLSPEMMLNVLAADNPGYLADYIAQSTPIPFEDKQGILDEPNPIRRLEKVLSIMVRENSILEIEADLQSKVREQITKHQRDYYLREQLKTIQEELGEEDKTEDEAERYRERIRALGTAQEIEEKLIKEADRLSRMNSQSPETAVVRTYLDAVLDLPWNHMTKDRLDIGAARRILDREHYGLQKVKERILEFLAVKRLAPDLKGQILCLVGPPGVGKTSVALSVAEALKRKSARLSLGGVRDEADIRGHRKTYVGAMPGRVMNAMRLAGSRNPVLLLDEIDKLSSDFRGDPSAALLEVLDPEQNAAFRDHYLEVPFDLSEVLFITTANTTDTIPRALLDRMEVIEITSYTDEEKLRIVKRHLLPKQLKRHGLTKSRLSFTDSAIRELIAGYTRESGVRNLEREIAAACRKTAKNIAEGQEPAARRALTPADLEGLLGVRRYKPERRRGEDEVGVANGLAWTRVGGELLEVEVGVVDGTGKIELTGNMGDIMKESARAALTYIRSRAAALEIEPDFYKNKDMHIHFPESAVPKDGPSAGITMAAAMVSALCGAPVYRHVAMTGEISLRGRVLPIGGLKEKTMAAYRAGIKTVIIPSANENDLQDIDPTVQGALHFICAEHMDTVLKNTVDFSRRSVGKNTAEDGLAGITV